MAEPFPWTPQDHPCEVVYAAGFCSNGGTCLMRGARLYDSMCACAPGWSGLHCDTAGASNREADLRSAAEQATLGLRSVVADSLKALTVKSLKMRAKADGVSDGEFSLLLP